MRNFFISHSSSDIAWAEWIAWQLDQAGYSTVLAVRDFPPGSNFVTEIQKAILETERTIAILSPDYLRSDFTQLEWTNVLGRDPASQDGKLVPVRVRMCDPTGLLSSILFIDLILCRDENATRNALLTGVQRIARPTPVRVRPPRRSTPRPLFPGSLSQESPSLPPPSNDRPYKFLDYYEPSDADVFFGREADILSVSHKIQERSFLVLYGASGVGKTSLLLAGLLPYLENLGYWCVHVRCEDDPEWSIKRRILRHWPADRPNLQAFLGDSLPQFLANARDHLGRDIVIFLDQFEEFFLRLGPAARSVFEKVISDWYALDPPPFRMVFAIREDFLGRIDELKEALPNPLASTHRLANLTRESARLAIEKPAERAGLLYEMGVLDLLLDELTTQSRVEKGIFPPHLQLVCSRLSEAADPASGLITKRDLQKIGGITLLLDKYIEQALSTLSLEQQGKAWEILKITTTAARTKFAVKAEEICTDEESQELLGKLVERRLVRRIAEDGQVLYELAHDKIAETLTQRMSDAEKTARDLQDMLRVEYMNWQQHGVPLAEDKLALVARHRGNPHLKLPLTWEVFLRESERKRRRARWRQRTPLFGSVAVLLILVGIYFWPMMTTPRPHLERVSVEKGPFELGTDSGSPHAAPRHRVFVGPFEVSKYEVTNAEYGAFVKARHWDRPDSDQFGKPEYATYPVVGVSWEDAQAFCQWVGGRLPTEAEWEKAATWDPVSGRKLAFPWGDEWVPERIGAKADGLANPAPVRSYPRGRSPFGVMNMVANVAEWTSSIDRPYPYNSYDGREDPETVAPRIVRGWSWARLASASQPTNRTGSNPRSRDARIGFRVAWNVREAPSEGVSAP